MPAPSKRAEARAARPVNRDSFIDEWPETGLILFHSPADPEPSLRVELSTRRNQRPVGETPPLAQPLDSD